MELVKSPMPGTLLEYKVQSGDKVSVGDPLFILDAMKMHNEIRAEKSGTISDLSDKIGGFVNTEDVIMKIN